MTDIWTITATTHSFASKSEEEITDMMISAFPDGWATSFDAPSGRLSIHFPLEATDEGAAIVAGAELVFKALSTPSDRSSVVAVTAERFVEEPVPDNVWRATATTTVRPFTDDQREKLVFALPGFVTVEDDAATGALRVEFDVEAFSERGAEDEANRLFGSQNIRDILGAGYGKVFYLSVVKGAEV